MSAFIYYVPNKSKCVLDEGLARMHGLGYAMDATHTFNAAPIESGPDGSRGVVAYTGEGGFQNLAKVKWMAVPGSKAFVGLDPDGIPGPADLARPEQFDGHWVSLEDDNRWLVPVARAVTGVSPLPRRLQLVDGMWTPGDLLPRYTRLFAAACRLWDSLVGAISDEVSVQDECDVAAEALALNYRIGPVEISLLGLFSTASHAAVCKAVLDWQVLEQIKKKVDAGELSLAPGGEG